MRSVRVFLLVLAPLMAWAQEPASQLDKQVKKVVDVFTIMSEQAADPVSPDKAFFQGAIPGMLRTLDPHSVFFDPDQFQQLNEMQNSEQKGFGSIVSVLPGRVIVLQALQGTPSEKAGLSGGDEIVAINGIPLANLQFEQLVQLLTVARQRDVTLEVRRPGNASLLRIDMSPKLMDKPTVDRSFQIAPGIGYLRVTSFEQPTGTLIRETIEQLGGSNLKGLILDLRNNPGGAVQAAIETASLFLKPEQLIFSIKGRNAKAQEVRTAKYGRPYMFPMAVLVNGKTASASEILSGALQDHDRAVILGEPSYGKGLVQQVFMLSDNTGLALTTAFYYTPSGRWIQKPLKGVQLGAATLVDKGPYKTDSGREVRGGGGIQPDETVYPEQQSRLQIVLDASGVLTSFADEYLRAHKNAKAIQVTPAVLDQFESYAAGRRIQPSIGEWLAIRDWVESRLQQEIANLKFGVAKGDEIELKRDPVVQRALARLQTH